MLPALSWQNYLFKKTYLIPIKQPDDRIVFEERLYFKSLLPGFTGVLPALHMGQVSAL
jgi:hypothetical protein